MEVIVEEAQVPNLTLPQLIYQYGVELSQHQELTETKAKILKIITDDKMPTIYQELCLKFGWESHNHFAQSLVDSNQTELQQMEETDQQMSLTSGDIEILDTLLKKGRFFSRTGNWTKAFEQFDLILSKEKAGNSRKIEAWFEKAKIALFNSDIEQLKSFLTQASSLVEIGGDWDKRNKLKVFEALHCLLVRDFRKASSLLLEGVATFSSTDLCSYESFMFYSVLTNILILPRTELKSKIIENAQVISIFVENPKLNSFLQSIYTCSYEEFLNSLMDLYPAMQQDRFLGPHLGYLLKEFRVKAFSQFLEAYKSVTLSSMAQAFGVPVPLLDQELSRFIASDRLSAKIDKVGDLIETSRSDERNTQYQEIIKKGDNLLNQIQKLVRVIAD